MYSTMQFPYSVSEYTSKKAEIIMGSTNQWLVEGRLYVFHIWGDLTLEEMKQGSDEAIHYVRSGQPPVHSIIDFRNVTSYPKSISDLKNAADIMKEPNLGWVLLLTNDRIFSFVGDLISQMTRKNYKSVKTPEEAIDLLWKVDQSLPSEKITYPTLKMT